MSERVFGNPITYSTSPGAAAGGGTVDLVAREALEALQVQVAALAPPDLSGYATTAAVNAGLAGKQASGDYLTASETTILLGGYQLAGDYQPAGDYATNTALAAGLATKQASGDYATNAALTSGLAGKQDTGNYALVGHTHAIADVTGLQTALDAKQVSGDYATNTALTNGLAGKQTSGNYSLVGHTHAIADVTGLQTALNGKQAAGTYASGSGSASGTNTGDETKATIDTKIGASGGTTEFYRKDGAWAVPAGGGGGGVVRTIYRLTAAHANSTLTPTTISNAAGANPWTHTLVTNKTYRVTIFATHQTAAATTGGRMNLLGAGGLAGAVAGMMWGGIAQAAAASTLEVPIYSFANGAGAFLLTTAVNPINSPHIWGADFVFRCTTGGTLSLQWASEVNASVAQLNIGSVMIVEEIE